MLWRRACEAAETAEDSEAGLHDVRVALNEALSALTIRR